MIRAIRRVAPLLLLATLSRAAPAQAKVTTTRVLVIFAHDPNAPGVLTFIRPFQAAVRAGAGQQVEFFSEPLDFDRFGYGENWPQVSAYLKQKYDGFPIDVIVTEGSAALKFAVERLRGTFPGVPIVYGVAYEPIVDFDKLPANVTGRRLSISFAPTFSMARRLMPTAKQAFLITGSVPMDSIMAERAVADIAPLLGGMRLEVLRSWTYPSLLKHLRELPPESFVILSSARKDWTGMYFNTGDLIPSLSRASTAPIFGVARNWLGDGVVGGVTMNFANDGEHVARLVLAVLNRAPGAPLPAREVAVDESVVDWRQLQRWNFSEKALTKDTKILFRPPSTWDRYKGTIVVVLAVIAAQSVLIALLMLERRKRMSAQESLVGESMARDVETLALAESRDHVAHMARVATMSQLGAAVTHELRQPLTAIRVHAETGSVLLDQSPPDVDEAREVFREIARDNSRAVEVIQHVRMLLRKEAPVIGVVSISNVCLSVAKLVQRDADTKGVSIDVALSREPSTVRGDVVQLQQVVINLVMNAIEAAATSSADRRVQLRTAACDGHIQVEVTDSGPGLDPSVQKRLFETYFSTKQGGLGMGLTIVRQIVEQHGGKVEAHNGAAGGAVFRVTLPAESPA